MRSLFQSRISLSLLHLITWHLPLPATRWKTLRNSHRRVCSSHLFLVELNSEIIAHLSMLSLLYLLKLQLTIHPPTSTLICKLQLLLQISSILKLATNYATLSSHTWNATKLILTLLDTMNNTLEKVLLILEKVNLENHRLSSAVSPLKATRWADPWKKCHSMIDKNGILEVN